MPKNKHKPPSRVRYEEKNPTISFRVSVEIYEKLCKIREKTGKSYADIIKEGMGVQEPMVKDTYTRGYRAGYDKGKRAGKREGEVFSLGSCASCGGVIQWDLSSNEQRNTLASAISQARFVHKNCNSS